MNRSDGTLYAALETALASFAEPVTCNDLYDVPDVAKHAESVNRVSDYLGNMWRAGKLLRYPSTRPNDAARWMYALKPASKKKRLGEPVPPPVPHRLGIIEVIEGTNDVIVNLPELQIIFRPRR